MNNNTYMLVRKIVKINVFECREYFLFWIQCRPSWRLNYYPMKYFLNVSNISMHLIYFIHSNDWIIVLISFIRNIFLVHLNFHHIKKSTFDQFYRKLLLNPQIKRQISSLKLSNESGYIFSNTSIGITFFLRWIICSSILNLDRCKKKLN
jgi:hypothetical protein